MEKLAILGGTPVLDPTQVPDNLTRWPIFTQEDEDALLDAFHNNTMSGNTTTVEYEKEFAAWQGVNYAVAAANGTMALQAAMYAIGLQAGDELICPTKTYWASCLSAQNLGVSVVFANIQPHSMNLDPEDLERCLSPWTKAIMVVHYCGYPAQMDKIMAFAKKHNLKVIEDVSHAQGGLYKGKKLGTFGDVAAMSMMSGKSLACGELGMFVTDNKEYRDRALAYLHYERNNEENIDTEYLKEYYHMPLSGMKGRANQLCTAYARVQLKYYDERCVQIRKAMNYFWDQLEGVPGIRAHRVDESEGSNMAGWYSPQMLYYAEELGGLDPRVFVKAVEAECGFSAGVGANFPLHTHPIFQTFDLIGLGKPARIAYAHRDVRELDKDLERSEKVQCVSIPWFKTFQPKWLELYAAAYRKVAENYQQLLDLEKSSDVAGGQWYGKVNR